MTSPTRLVHIVDEVPELADIETLPMVVALDGFLDAGNAGALAARHLVRTGAASPDGGGVVVATFDVDQLHDYRARRPPMTFARDHYEGYDAPRLVVRLLHDHGGAPYLLLHGPEPDIRWEAFCRAVLEVVERFGVRLVVSMGSVPMAVPHTRPVTMTAHAGNKELIADHTPWVGEVQVPASVSNLLEYRMIQHGHEALGFTVHVPHYLAQTAYPPAAEALLGEVSRIASLQIPLHALSEAGADVYTKISEQVEASSEVAQVVTALEQQYDSFVAAQENRSLLARDEELPSGDELGAQFEQFLAEQSGDGLPDSHPGDDGTDGD